MYKMIILDLDGTLLNDYKQVLKEKADFITASNNDNGVAKAIQKIIFNKEDFK